MSLSDFSLFKLMILSRALSLSALFMWCHSSDCVKPPNLPISFGFGGAMRECFSSLIFDSNIIWILRIGNDDDGQHRIVMHFFISSTPHRGIWYLRTQPISTGIFFFTFPRTSYGRGKLENELSMQRSQNKTSERKCCSFRSRTNHPQREKKMQ